MTNTRKVFGFTGLVLAMFMGALDATIVNIALPDIMKDLKTGLTDTSWVATIYVLAMAVFIITVSKLADIYGRKLLMLIGVLLFGGFSFACMTAHTIPLLISYRFFQGVGGAILTPIVLPMGIELFGKKNTSKVTAIIGAFSALAAAGGPVIGGLIIHLSNYRWIFGINIPIALIALILIAFGTCESFDKSVSKHIDWFGMLFLTSCLAGVTFGLLEGHDYGWSSPTIITSFVLSAISLIVLLVIERFVKSPIIDLQLFKEKTFSASSLIYLIFGFAIIIPSLILNYFLQNVRSYSALHSAYLIVPASLAIAVGMPLATKLYQKISSKLLIGIGIVITAGGLAMLSCIQYETSRDFIIACNVIIGFGLGFMAMALTASVKYLPVNKTGIGSGIVNAARYIGQALGMAILVSLLSANVNTAKNSIRSDAYRQINKSHVSSQVKSVAKREIKKAFKTSDSSSKISTQKNSMIKPIKQEAKKDSNIPIPKKGSDHRKLYDAMTKLEKGTNTLNEVLPSQLMPVKTSLRQLGQGQTKVTTAIKLLAQKDELSSIFNHIVKTKNHELSRAFSHVYLTGMILLLLCLPLTIYTERKV